MAIEFIEDDVIINSNGPGSANSAVTFSAPVISAQVVLQGWGLEFLTTSPAPIAHRVDAMRANVILIPPVGGQPPEEVRFQYDFNLADAGGGDSYRASLRAMVIAEL